MIAIKILYSKVLRNRLLICSFLFMVAQMKLILSYSQQIPPGYVLQFENSCNSDDIFKSLNVEMPENFIMNNYLHFIPPEIYTDTVSTSEFPAVRGVIDDLILGDFIIDFEYLIEKESIDSCNFYFLAPIRTKNEYYAFEVSSNQICFNYIKNGNLTTSVCQALELNRTGWTRLTIKRDILKSTMSFFTNGAAAPEITFTDRNLVMDFIGFGANSCPCKLRNIKIWGPTSIRDKKFEW